MLAFTFTRRPSPVAKALPFGEGLNKATRPLSMLLNRFCSSTPSSLAICLKMSFVSLLHPAQVPQRPPRQRRDDVRADPAGVDVRRRPGDRLHPCRASAHRTQCRRGRGRARRADAGHDAAIQRDGADRREEHVQRPDRRLTSLAPGDTTVTVTVTNPTGNTLVRNVTVSYTAQNENIFAGVLGAPTFQLAGSSTASASVAANINFYLLLDNSPSMALPATQAGVRRNVRAADRS